jgi:hypothetical protein
VSRVAPKTGERVEIEARKAFRKSIVTAAHLEQDGLCALCPNSLGKTFIRDHRQPRAQGGKTDKDNLQLICIACALKKDPADNSATAKAKRLSGERPQKPSKRPLRSRGFDKTHSRRMNGTVTRREQP